MGTDLTVFNRLRPMSIGFDNLFDHFNTMLESSHFANGGASYPPYNVIRTGDNTYTIEIAAAGFRKEEISVELEKNTLTISTHKAYKREDGQEVIHRGISQRRFTRSFRLAENVEVVDAKMEDGLLQIELEHVVPEEDQPRIISIR